MGGCCSEELQQKTEDNDERLDDVQEMLRELGAEDEQKSSKVTLRVACRELAGKWDAMIIVNDVPDGTDRKRTFVGKTEVIRGAASPVFVNTISVTYQFGVVQNLVFELVHEDKKGEQKVMGATVCSLQSLIESGTHTADLRIPAGSKVGDIVIKTEMDNKNAGPEYEVMFVFGCSGIESKNMFGAIGGSDPFLVVSRVVDGGFLPVAKTEYYENVTEVAQWKPLVIKLERLCRMNFNATLLFEVFDWESSGNHQLIGSARTTLADVLASYDTLYPSVNGDRRIAENRRAEPYLLYELVNDTKRGKEKYLHSGLLQLHKVGVETSHSFLEYVRGGFDINLTICVDFSSSNLDHVLHGGRSLHHNDKNRSDNEYVSAMRSVLQVLGEYDKDQIFNFYGFGASEGGGEVLSIFPVTGDPNRVEVHGIDGVVDAYWSCLARVTPSEPSRFSPCLRKGLNLAMASNKESYQIVLFITDGAISDFSQTVDVIVQASAEPVSVLIVGVGNGDFEQMDELDGDEKPLVGSDGKSPGRDLVGFVPYRDFIDAEPQEFAKEVLKEIPRQFVGWAKLHGVKPPVVESDGEESSEDIVQDAVEVTIRKQVDEPLGLNVRDMVIDGTVPGTVSHKNRLQSYRGYMITHINGRPVYSEVDVPPLVQGQKKIILRMRRAEVLPEGFVQDNEESSHSSSESMMEKSSRHRGGGGGGDRGDRRRRRRGGGDGDESDDARGGGHDRRRRRRSKEDSRRDHGSSKHRRRRGDDDKSRHKHRRHHRERRRDDSSGSEGGGARVPAYSSIASFSQKDMRKPSQSHSQLYDFFLIFFIEFGSKFCDCTMDKPKNNLIRLSTESLRVI